MPDVHFTTLSLTNERTYVSDLKHFLYDPTVVDPLDVARRDLMEFFVESILHHLSILPCTFILLRNSQSNGQIIPILTIPGNLTPV